ncbi:MAG TPA: L-seryl-tRNA(Sec) selenium transferase [Chloroflexota bacterium]|nr:L-seryl-tRNA(Sec) selenium transferase [Chloroflexota bacterium]
MTIGFRELPSVEALLRHPAVQAPDGSGGRARHVLAARRVLADARTRIAAGEPAPSAELLASLLLAIVQAERTPHLRPVINATGVILQTNLGRAPLSEAALEAMLLVASGYSNLEYDLGQGQRGSRQTGIGSLIAAVSGAQAGLVVNNNASAILLTLAGLAAGKDVLVSRGQLVEIGGGFRIPDVLRQSGARLVEVGTTNRTYVRDFEAAMTPATAAILRVHPSNFVQSGFVQQPDLADLAALARARGVLMLDDLGGGALLDTASVGLAHEPTVQESVASGVDIVCFSGDKLVGGPQSGILAGDETLLRTLAGHPLARAVRLDKLSLAALEATLRLYLIGEAADVVPVWRMLRRSPAEIAVQAATWAERFQAAGLPATVLTGVSTVGGGSLPGETLPTSLVALPTVAVEALARRLRTGEPAIVARIQRDSLLLDARTVAHREEERLLLRVVEAWDAG